MLLTSLYSSLSSLIFVNTSLSFAMPPFNVSQSSFEISSCWITSAWSWKRQDKTQSNCWVNLNWIHYKGNRCPPCSIIPVHFYWKFTCHLDDKILHETRNDIDSKVHVYSRGIVRGQQGARAPLIHRVCRLFLVCRFFIFHETVCSKMEWPIKT